MDAQPEEFPSVESDSEVAESSKLKKQRTIATESALAPIDIAFEAAARKQKNGKASYWPHVAPYKCLTKDKVFFQCNLCEKLLSTKNPADSVGNHIVAGTDGKGTTCKGVAAHHAQMDAALKQAVGVTRRSEIINHCHVMFVC